MAKFARTLTGKILLQTAAVSAVAAMLNGGAWAQEKKGAVIEEITVTANKRKEDIQQVPIAVSAFSGENLEKLGLANFVEAARFVPGLQIVNSNVNRNSTVLIRGIGSSGTNPGIEPSVGIFMDGVFIPVAGPIQGNLLDIAGIETLRGPQGTLYGRNTAVGALNITTREPTAEREGLIKVGAGNFGYYGVSGYYGGAITDELSGRISLWENSRGGYFKNLLIGGMNNDNRQWGGRMRLKWQPTENVTSSLIGYYSKTDAHCCTAEPINPTGIGGIANTTAYPNAAAAIGRPMIKYTSLDHTVVDAGRGANYTKVYGVSHQLDWTIFDNYTLTSITAYNAYDDKIPETAGPGVWQRPTTNVQRDLAETYSEELRITSPKGQMIDFLAGAYLFGQDVSYSQILSATADANRRTAAGTFLPTDQSVYLFDQNTKSEALFGQATWNITNAFRLTGGLRHSWERKSGSTSTTLNPAASAAFVAQNPRNPRTNLGLRETKLTWMTTLQYDLTEGVMTYATMSTGWKSAGFNARISPAGAKLDFGPENSLNYEWGVKSTLFDRRLVLNVDVYRLLVKGLQQSLLNPATGSGFIVGNAGNVKNTGIEFDLKWRPIEQLTFTASGAFNDSEIYDYTAGPCSTYPGIVANGSRPGTCNFNGRRPAYNPESTFSFGAEWRQPINDKLEMSFNVFGNYQSDMSLDAALDPRSLQKAYTLYNARIGLEDIAGRWSITVWGKNLTDKAYYITSSSQLLAAYMSAGGTTAPTGYVGWYGPPRTYGIEGTYRF